MLHLGFVVPKIIYVVFINNLYIFDDKAG